MKYTELKQEISKELNAFPMAFAFSNEQLEEGLKKLNATVKEVVSIGTGGFIRKTDKEAFSAMFKDHNKRMEDALKDDTFMIDALVYELGNHEYCITYDPTDTIECLDLDPNDKQVQRCFKEARRIYLEAVEAYA